MGRSSYNHPRTLAQTDEHTTTTSSHTHVRHEQPRGGVRMSNVSRRKKPKHKTDHILPKELWELILSWLDFDEQLTVGAVSRIFCEVTCASWVTIAKHLHCLWDRVHLQPRLQPGVKASLIGALALAARFRKRRPTRVFEIRIPRDCVYLAGFDWPRHGYEYPAYIGNHCRNQGLALPILNHDVDDRLYDVISVPVRARWGMRLDDATGQCYRDFYNVRHRPVNIKEWAGLRITTPGMTAMYTSVGLKLTIIEKRRGGVPEQAFAGLCNLHSVTCRCFVVGVSAFKGCGALTRVTLMPGLYCIRARAFHSCLLLREVELPIGLQEIHDRAFYRCANLKKVNLPLGLRTIGNEAFKDCVSLLNVELPHTITSIGLGAFSNSGLTSVVLPPNLTSLPEHVFSYCINLESVTLPPGLKTIGKFAFNTLMLGWHRPPHPKSVTLPYGCVSHPYAFTNGCRIMYQTTIDRYFQST